MTLKNSLYEVLFVPEATQIGYEVHDSHSTQLVFQLNHGDVVSERLYWNKQRMFDWFCYTDFSSWNFDNGRC
jgi:hypothetical protein